MFRLIGRDPDSIITFNYTNYYRTVFATNNIVHIHGDLDSEKIVLGFDDDKNNEQDYLIFYKHFQITQNGCPSVTKNDDIFNTCDVEKKKTGVYSKMPNEIYFFGFSFDPIDADYINRLFILDEDTQIYILYSDENSRRKILENLYVLFDRETIFNATHNNKIIMKEIYEK